MESAVKGTFFLHVKGRQKLIGELLSMENELVNRDIGTRSVFECDNCEQRHAVVGHQRYVRIGDTVNTIYLEDKS